MGRKGLQAATACEGLQALLSNTHRRPFTAIHNPHPLLANTTPRSKKNTPSSHHDSVPWAPRLAVSALACDRHFAGAPQGLSSLSPRSTPLHCAVASCIFHIPRSSLTHPFVQNVYLVLPGAGLERKGMGGWAWKGRLGVYISWGWNEWMNELKSFSLCERECWWLCKSYVCA